MSLHGWNWPVVAQDTAGVILGVAMIALGLRLIEWAADLYASDLTTWDKAALSDAAKRGGDQSGKSNNHDGEVSK